MKEVTEIWEKLQSELTKLDKEDNKLKRFELSKDIAKTAIGRLEEFFDSHGGFSNDPIALCEFNRTLAPPIYAKFIFFSKVSAFEGEN